MGSTTATRNPVHEDSGKWFFWDETWANRQGPFDTEKEAYEKMEVYKNQLEPPAPDGA